jgi:1-aminocyclopropane-1-carboxylate deaminase
MKLQDEMHFSKVFIQEIDDEIFRACNVKLHILRLDEIHPVISGNKWFKLKYYLHDAITSNHTTIATFGGAFSNHILATAYACNKQNIKSIGFIRGEKPQHYSQTLLDAEALHMRLEFISRHAYSNKQDVVNANPSLFFIPEGGYGRKGAEGAAEILQLIPGISRYDHIVCATGTGTMLAGVANAGLHHQRFTGVSVMKNNFTLKIETLALVNIEAKSRVNILHDHHFGGYAKHTQQLFDFMNRMQAAHRLPLDFVYTAKALYALYDLAKKNYFIPGSNILFIHSGGLQGNRSLPRQIYPLQ